MMRADQAVKEERGEPGGIAVLPDLQGPAGSHDESVNRAGLWDEIMGEAGLSAAVDRGGSRKDTVLANVERGIGDNRCRVDVFTGLIRCWSKPISRERAAGLPLAPTQSRRRAVPGALRSIPQLSRHLVAVHDRHAQIQKNELRLERSGHVERVQPS